ncbi:transcriptional regulator, MarR family protein [Marinobacter lipolyticus SM19]|uniref:Transcriptional regulator, MarR family protein n=1 Tax=Marinobacter lipolyticus SM19 TaxID=1318628 RepID=R8AX41_9GAMM|nr:MarR family transcriptional regulator [Marinobacter lipolyticus]EON90895.1 transcriptional regulator, MarR family protein [Marinobacter lipolyticus SM19]
MDKRLFYLLNIARHRVYKHADQLSEEALGISVTQVGALLLVAGDEGCLLKDLARHLNLNNSALTGLAGRMEHKGLLERRPCDHDGRASRLYLTDLGRRKIDSAKPLITELNERMTEGFTDDEVDVILRFLNRLVNDF